MIIIGKNLDLIVYKNKSIKISKNNIAYLKNNDKILFEVDGDKFEINFKNFSLKKENNDSVFYIDNNKSSLKLKEINQTFDIKIESININKDDNKYIINYKLESDEELTSIKIITYND